ncbi:hypothetical protein FOL47_008425 [Perkinsus chesapeaki]|uniref:Uncharacterized protein n=1 Tax=Perkinsus chesapeaki TaxID=330153 RepID=A0A7J6MU69_PERCH|nr:hypothetical protein FOL47_008425 [Perkinsus chesapeaki]
MVRPSIGIVAFILAYSGYAALPPPQPTEPQPTDPQTTRQMSYACTLPCKSDSECPANLEGNAEPYCAATNLGGYCSLKCYYGRLSCPEYMGCGLNTNVGRSECYTPV